MKRKDKQGARGIMVGLATAGLVFCQLVACDSPSNTPLAGGPSPANTADATADAGVTTDAISESDASEPANFCTGPATGALIDDMSGSSISLQPPPCGTKGTWYALPTSGSLTIPPGDPATVANCGSDCLSLYSPLPDGFPGPAASGDGGAPGPRAMCIAGQTGTTQYAWSGMQLALGWSGAVPAGGAYLPDGRTLVLPALIDASDYGGIEFWLWVSPDTAASVTSSLQVSLIDKNQLPGGGVCDANGTGATVCATAGAAVAPATAALHYLGRLFADDGSKLSTLAGGWQHVRAPWSSFTTNPYWGGANELTVDPRTLFSVEIGVQQDSTSGPAVPFDFCVYQLSFLPKSDVPVPGDGGSYCSGAATGALIDDMSASSISLAPPACGTTGAWFPFSSGTLTTPSEDASSLSNCGSLCQSLYSPLPAGSPGPTTTGDDGGASAPEAMCIAGQTSPNQYSTGGLALEFAFSGAVPTGGPTWTNSGGSGFTTDPPPALIDASQYSGVEFWLWVPEDMVDAVASNFEVRLVDKNQLRGAGICDPNDTTGIHACDGAAAGISFSVVAATHGSGPLFGDDGSELSGLVAGWQHVRAPWSSFVTSPYYGGANESVVDPKALAFAQFMVQQTRPSGAAIPFDFCIYGLKFY